MGKGHSQQSAIIRMIYLFTLLRKWSLVHLIWIFVVNRMVFTNKKSEMSPSRIPKRERYPTLISIEICTIGPIHNSPFRSMNSNLFVKRATINFSPQPSWLNPSSGEPEQMNTWNWHETSAGNVSSSERCTLLLSTSVFVVRFEK